MRVDTRTRVLLVEDNPGDARLARELLQDVSSSFSTEVASASTLHEALSLLEAESFAAVLLDLSLPDSRDLDGLATIRERAPGVPVIMITGLDDQAVALRALESGAQDYVVKGRFDGGLLARSIRYAIERQRTVDQLREREREAKESASVAEARSAELAAAMQDLLHEVARREKAEESLRAESAVVELLHAVSAGANEAPHAAAAIESTLRLVCDRLGWPAGHCLQFGLPGVPAGFWYVADEQKFASFRALIDQSGRSSTVLRERVIATGAAAWSDDPLEFLPFRGDSSIRSALAFPVLVEKEVVAILEFFSDRASDARRPLLAEWAQISAQVGSAIIRERAERALRDSEDRYRDLVEANEDMICTHDLDGYILQANRAMIHALSGGKDDLSGRHLREFVTAEFRERVADYLAQIRSQPETHGLMRIRNAQGNVRILEYRNTRRTEGTPQPIVRAVARDITEKFLVERALARSERRFRLLFERNLAGICRLTMAGEILDCNDALAKILGYERGESLLAAGHGLLPVNVEWEDILDELKKDGFVSNEELSLARRDGSLVWVLSNLTQLPGEGTEAPSIEAICIDITGRKESEAEVAFRAHHDPLTRLANRYSFLESLDQALRNRRDASRGLAVLYVDLDGFKSINDGYGHYTGDLVLRAVADRIVDCLRSSDIVARIGGDEFAILLSGSADRAIAGIAAKVIDQVSEPIRIQEAELRVSASIGIAVAPRDGTDQATLMRKSDEAMYRAKTSGKNAFRFYEVES